jgi:hypothetical protein
MSWGKSPAACAPVAWARRRMKFWRARANAGMSIVLTCPCIVPEAEQKRSNLQIFELVRNREGKKRR